MSLASRMRKRRQGKILGATYLDVSQLCKLAVCFTKLAGIHAVHRVVQSLLEGEDAGG